MITQFSLISGDTTTVILTIPDISLPCNLVANIFGIATSAFVFITSNYIFAENKAKL